VRHFAFVAASLAGLHLLLMFSLGLMFITTDWRVFECFDGTEPACDEPARDTGLAAIDAIVWLLGGLAVAATLAALVLAFRLRRVADLAPVLVLSAASVAFAQAPWWL